MVVVVAGSWVVVTAGGSVVGVATADAAVEGVVAAVDSGPPQAVSNTAPVTSRVSMRGNRPTFITKDDNGRQAFGGSSC